MNREFADGDFGSATKAIGGYYKSKEGTRIQVVGIVEDGKYRASQKTQWRLVFLPILQSPSSQTWLVVRAAGDPRQVTAALKNRLRDLDAGMPFFIQAWSKEMDAYQFGAHMATISLGVLGLMGAMLSITGIFGIAAYSVSKRLQELAVRLSLGAGQGVLLSALGRALNLLLLVRLREWFSAFWRAGYWLLSCIELRPAIRWYWVELFGHVVAGSCWFVDSARSVLKVDPVILLREK